MRRRAGRWLLGLLALGAMVWALTAGAVLWAADATLEAHLAGRSLEAPVDAIVVLGASIDKDGGLSTASIRRVSSAVAAYEAGKADALIVSGGPAGSAGTPVAVLMREHAIDLGVPPGRVLMEKRAASTFQNLLFAFEIAEANGMQHLALASDAYHLTRARLLAAYLSQAGVGLVAATGPSTAGFDWRFREIPREALAWWYNLGKVVAWEGLGTLGWEPEERGALVG